VANSNSEGIRVTARGGDLAGQYLTTRNVVLRNLKVYDDRTPKRQTYGIRETEIDGLDSNLFIDNDLRGASGAANELVIDAPHTRSVGNQTSANTHPCPSAPAPFWRIGTGPWQTTSQVRLPVGQNLTLDPQPLDTAAWWAWNAPDGTGELTRQWVLAKPMNGDYKYRLHYKGCQYAGTFQVTVEDRPVGILKSKSAPAVLQADAIQRVQWDLLGRSSL
jgi:hypothetical protein